MVFGIQQLTFGIQQLTFGIQQLTFGILNKINYLFFTFYDIVMNVFILRFYSYKYYIMNISFKISY